MSNSIFKLDIEHDDLLRIIEDAEGEITPEIEEKLLVNINNVEYKFKNYAFIILKLKGDTKIIDDEIERLKTLKKVKDGIIKKLENIIAMFLPKYGKRNDTKTGHNFIMDLQDVKISNRYGKPLSINETIEEYITAYIMSYIKNEEVPDYIHTELIENFDINIDKDKHIRSSINIKTSPDLIRSIYSIIKKLDFTSNTLEDEIIDIKVDIHVSNLKEDVKAGLTIPGIKIDDEKCSIIIK